MRLLANITFFIWDNYQGGSGTYSDNDVLVDIPPEAKVEDVMQLVRNEIEGHLKRIRPFDQTFYSKKQGEYIINSIRFIL